MTKSDFLQRPISYKEACELFNTTPSANGRDRRDQLVKWKRYANIQKMKNRRGKYFIERFYTKEEVQAKKDLLNYLKYLEGTMLGFFSLDKEDGNNLAFDGDYLAYTYKELRERINMVNNRYFPVKYKNDDLADEIKLKSTYSLEDFDREKTKWFEIVESIDKNSIRQVLKSLAERDLIQVIESYKFYYIAKGENKTYRTPRIATFGELGAIQGMMLQTVVDGVDKLAPGYKNYEVLKQKKADGELEGKDLYRLPMECRKKFDDKVHEYITSLGYNAYGRCFLIQIGDISDNLEYFSPKFNAIQVERFLKSKRFDVISGFIHKQLVDLLIKL